MKKETRKVKDGKINKKWLLIGNLVMIVVIIIAAVSCSGGQKKNKWTDVVMREWLPEPPTGKGKLYENSDEEFYLSINKVSDKEYEEYKDACIQKGFTVDAAEDLISYEAYNEEGYFLQLMQIGSSMSIRLKAPLQLESITWPVSELGQHLPQPESTVGRYSYEYENHFFLYVGNTGKTDYDAYVAECMKKGFTIGYEKGDTYYRADDEDGCHVSIDYLGNNIMTVEAKASEEKNTDEASYPATETTQESQEPEESRKPEESQKSEESQKPEESQEPEETPAPSEATDKEQGGIRSDFKKAMDSYEAFMDEYVAFMKKYSENPTDMNLLTDYADYMNKYADMMEKFEQWEGNDMSDAELAYYLEVQTRVSKKLLEASQY